MAHYVLAAMEDAVWRAGNSWYSGPFQRLHVRKWFAAQVRAGKINKGTRCESCGAEPERRLMHSHHRDYTKPLEVQWLCRTCHLALHRLPLVGSPSARPDWGSDAGGVC